MTNNSRAMFTSKKQDWCTPKWLFDRLDFIYHFSLDVAASDTNHLCHRYFTEKDNALTKDWGGHRVWMQPPYKRGLALWVKKAHETYQNGGEVVALLPARTDNAWFHDYVLNKADIFFIKGRLKFEGAPYNAPFPSMIVIWSATSTKVCESFFRSPS